MNLFKTKLFYAAITVKDTETDYALKILDKHKATHVEVSDHGYLPGTKISYLTTKRKNRRIMKDLRYYRVKILDVTTNANEIF